MKKISFIVLLAISICAGSLQAADAKKEDAAMASRMKFAEELLLAMDVDKALGRSFDMVKKFQARNLDMFVKKMKDKDKVLKFQNEIMDMMKKEMSWDNLKTDFIKIYAETYTEEELKGLVKFYQSPLGKKFISKQPEMQKRTMEMMRKIMMRVMPKIQQMTEKMKKEAMKEQAVAAPKTEKPKAAK